MQPARTEAGGQTARRERQQGKVQEASALEHGS
jgi:hypothetical protein